MPSIVKGLLHFTDCEPTRVRKTALLFVNPVVQQCLLAHSKWLPVLWLTAASTYCLAYLHSSVWVWLSWVLCSSLHVLDVCYAVVLIGTQCRGLQHSAVHGGCRTEISILVLVWVRGWPELAELLSPGAPYGLYSQHSVDACFCEDQRVLQSCRQSLFWINSKHEKPNHRIHRICLHLKKCSDRGCIPIRSSLLYLLIIGQPPEFQALSKL